MMLEYGRADWNMVAEREEDRRLIVVEERQDIKTGNER